MKRLTVCLKQHRKDNWYRYFLHFHNIILYIELLILHTKNIYAKALHMNGISEKQSAVWLEAHQNITD